MCTFICSSRMVYIEIKMYNMQLLWIIVPLYHYIRVSIDRIMSVANRIPPVLYVPAHPERDGSGERGTQLPAAYPRMPEPAASQHLHFGFLRTRSFKKAEDTGVVGTKGMLKKPLKKPEQVSWDENPEQGEYPFMRLEGNRMARHV